MLQRLAGIDRAYYFSDFLSDEDERELETFLLSVPERDPENYDPTQEFAFAHPVFDGDVVRERAEAAAGEPIWFQGAPVRGIPLPRPLAWLRDRAQATIAASDYPELAKCGRTLFTSVYVDHYEDGGLFVPHVDRDCYGSVVLGISIGPGRARLGFVHRDGSLPPRSMPVEPRSLYAFAGPVRWEPWLHHVADVTDRRFGISYRQAAQR